LGGSSVSSRAHDHAVDHDRAVNRERWAVNLLGCVFFAISAVAGYVVPATGSVLDLGAANFNTSLGAACFLACALATLGSGRTSKSPARGSERGPGRPRSRSYDPSRIPE
jgi:hypothetical protein